MICRRDNVYALFTCFHFGQVLERRYILQWLLQIKTLNALFVPKFQNKAIYLIYDEKVALFSSELENLQIATTAIR